MARDYLFPRNDLTIPPNVFDSTTDGSRNSSTLPEDDDPRRVMETQPDVDQPAQLNKQERPVPVEDPVYHGDTIVDDEIKPPRRTEFTHARFRRVVGWMVGVKGPCRGVDYRLHEGKNYIGRSPRCEVNVEDLKVSSGNVAQVVFDPRSKRFFSSDCDGTSTICYQNGEPLLGRNQIELYDSIELGDSKLIFVPLCGEHFTWNENEGE